tara:strand:- start:235 stop:702 length:468 start_codon:yes stop_codon:yes gene_type:complete
MFPKSYNVYKSNCKFGQTNETDTLNILQNLYNLDIHQSKEKYCNFDFYSEDMIIELKSRRISSTDYKNTMIGMKKVNKMLENPKRAYLLFKYTDKVLGLELTEKNIKLFEQHTVNYFIPISLLIPLDDLFSEYNIYEDFHLSENSIKKTIEIEKN